MISFTVGTWTDVGVKKKVNQDAIFFESARTPAGPVAMAAICDGMGGLASGEKASAVMTSALGDWFENTLAAFLAKEGTVLTLEAFQEQLDFLVKQADTSIREAVRSASGTTLAAVFLGPGQYFTVNVGDSRVYHIGEGIEQLTKDQTLVQQELDAGLITEADIKTHPGRSVLLQCIGASEFIFPAYTSGTFESGDIFLLCSDGFRHMITQGEILESLQTPQAVTESGIAEVLKNLTELCKRRGEKDNISALAVRITDGARL